MRAGLASWAPGASRSRVGLKLENGAISSCRSVAPTDTALERHAGKASCPLLPSLPAAATTGTRSRTRWSMIERNALMAPLSAGLAVTVPENRALVGAERLDKE